MPIILWAFLILSKTSMNFFQKSLLFIVFAVFSFGFSSAQVNNRITCEFSMKEKLKDGKLSLIMGKIYYDKHIKKIVYDITFPEKEVWIMQDTFMYRIVPNQPPTTQGGMPGMVEFSIFHLALSGDLTTFGLRNSQFKIKKVEKDNGMILTHWAPPAAAKKYLGNIIVSQKDKNLTGVAFFNKENQVISKQIFKNYTKSANLDFPTEIIQVFYVDEVESYKITTFKNILVDDSTNERYYNYPIPK
jgi:hypothetical protein